MSALQLEEMKRIATVVGRQPFSVHRFWGCEHRSGAAEMRLQHGCGGAFEQEPTRANPWNWGPFSRLASTFLRPGVKGGLNSETCEQTSRYRAQKLVSCPMEDPVFGQILLTGRLWN